jgi:hypothetical protein
MIYYKITQNVFYFLQYVLKNARLFKVKLAVDIIATEL